MYARISRMQVSPERIGDIVDSFKNTTLPALRAIPGYAGSSLGVNASTGDGQAVTFWDSKESAVASREAATRLRTSVVEATGATLVSVQEYDQLLFERVTPPSLPAFLRVTRGSVDPTKIDQLATAMRDEALPAVRGLAGFRALVLGVDRESAQFAITSVWDTAANRDASETTINSLRDRIFGNVGIGTPEVSKYEVKSVEFVGVGAAT